MGRFRSINTLLYKPSSIITTQTNLLWPNQFRAFTIIRVFICFPTYFVFFICCSHNMNLEREHKFLTRGNCIAQQSEKKDAFESKRKLTKEMFKRKKNWTKNELKRTLYRNRAHADKMELTLFLDVWNRSFSWAKFCIELHISHTKPRKNWFGSHLFRFVRRLHNTFFFFLNK